jgi:hypothetical protein
MLLGCRCPCLARHWPAHARLRPRSRAQLGPRRPPGSEYASELAQAAVRIRRRGKQTPSTRPGARTESRRRTTVKAQRMRTRFRNARPKEPRITSRMPPSGVSARFNVTPARLSPGLTLPPAGGSCLSCASPLTAPVDAYQPLCSLRLLRSEVSLIVARSLRSVLEICSGTDTARGQGRTTSATDAREFALTRSPARVFGVVSACPVRRLRRHPRSRERSIPPSRVQRPARAVQLEPPIARHRQK